MAEKYKYVPTRFMLPTSRYSKRHADYAVAFIETLTHTKGEFSGKPFKLFPWQEQIVRDIFGILKPDGYRQFNHCFVEICKKSGKSELAAAIALFLLCADKEQGAEIYGVANDHKQASVVFNLARDMVRMNPTLSRVCTVLDGQKRIVFPPTRGFYTALSSEVKTKYGLNVHGCVFDEFLGQTDRSLYDVMVNGAEAARKQPLSFIITTAGSDKTSICYELHQMALDIDAGRKIDPAFYPAIFSAGEDDDWRDPEVWKRVNPSWGKIVSQEYYERFVENAKTDPALELQFRQFFLCQWTSTTKRWLPMDRYEKCGAPLPDLNGRVCFGGLDLASSEDIAAFVLVFPPDDPRDEYYVLPFFWIPSDGLARRVKVPYGKWHQQGHLSVTDGNIIHYDFIEKQIVELTKKYNIKEVMYDRWGAIQMAQNLKGHGFKMTDFGQGFQSMSPPAKELFRLVKDQKLMHGGHPVLRWMMENVYIEMDAAGNIKPNKKRSAEKIDGVVATIMALDGAIRREDKKHTGGSIMIIDCVSGDVTRNGELVKNIGPGSGVWRW